MVLKVTLFWFSITSLGSGSERKLFGIYYQYQYRIFHHKTSNMFLLLFYSEKVKYIFISGGFWDYDLYLMASNHELMVPALSVVILSNNLDLSILIDIIHFFVLFLNGFGTADFCITAGGKIT